MPQVIVIAGPNGAGKSTSAPALVEGIPFVNADEIAKYLSPQFDQNVNLQAGRLMRERLDDLERQHTDFALETTLASRCLRRAWSDCGTLTTRYGWCSSGCRAWNLPFSVSPTVSGAAGMTSRKRPYSGDTGQAYTTSSICTNRWLLPGGYTTMRHPENLSS